MEEGTMSQRDLQFIATSKKALSKGKMDQVSYGKKNCLKMRTLKRDK